MIPPLQILSLEQAEEKITEIILGWPRTVGELEVASQRGELAGYIECMAWIGIISEITRAILNAIYCQGWDRYAAIAQFGLTNQMATIKTTPNITSDNP